MSSRQKIIIIGIFVAILGIFVFSKRIRRQFTRLFREPYIEGRPNIIVIMTDQERYPCHWPKNWIEKHMPSYAKIKKHGLYFTHAYTGASECCPSRAVMMSSEYYPINQVPTTQPLIPLPPASLLPSIGHVMKQEGYDVVWKGKWHLSNPVNTSQGENDWTSADINNMESLYGFSRWNAPDAGNILDAPFMFSLGGGNANNDERYVKRANAKLQTPGIPGYEEGVIEYLEKKAQEKGKPFCLFVSFVNPHDIWIYPTYWSQAGYKREDFTNMGIELPKNLTDDLSTKPSIQKTYREVFDTIFPLPYEMAKKEYVNFYAYLHTVVDKQINSVMNAIEKNGLLEKSIIIRTADHGEAGLSHGLRQKAYTAYEEMIHVPLIISNPILFPTSKITDSLYSHLDLFPTILDLCGGIKKYGKGKSIVPVIKNPAISVQDSVLFCYDDVIPGLNSEMPSSHIRAVRKGNYTYAIYFTPLQLTYEYEMYDLSSDPLQLNNLLYNESLITGEIRSVASELDDELRAKITENEALPLFTIWPENKWSK